MAVKRTELAEPRTTKGRTTSNGVTKTNGRAADNWKLPDDLDELRRKLAQDLLDMVEMKSGVTAADVEQVSIICRASQRADKQRRLAEVALENDDISTYAKMARLVLQTETAVRRGIADLGMLPADRASKLSRTIAAQGGGTNQTGLKWSDV